MLHEPHPARPARIRPGPGQLTRPGIVAPPGRRLNLTIGTIIDRTMTERDDVAEPCGPDDDLVTVSGLEQTRDDTDIGWGEAPGGRDDEADLERYLRERPPHHGG